MTIAEKRKLLRERLIERGWEPRIGSDNVYKFDTVHKIKYRYQFKTIVIRFQKQTNYGWFTIRRFLISKASVKST